MIIIWFSAIAAAITATAAVATFVVLVRYTNETQLLRQTSQEQLEGSIRPIVLLEIESGEDIPGQRPGIKTPHLRNIGMGPAFSVAIDPIVGSTDAELLIKNVTLIESKGIVPADCITRQSSQTSGLARFALLDHLFATGRFPDGTSVTVNFKGLSKSYRVLQSIRYEPYTGAVWTEFVRIEPTEN